MPIRFVVKTIYFEVVVANLLETKLKMAETATDPKVRAKLDELLLEDIETLEPYLANL